MNGGREGSVPRTLVRGSTWLFGYPGKGRGRNDPGAAQVARTAAEDGALSWTGNNTVPVLEKFHTLISEGKAILFIYLFIFEKQRDRKAELPSVLCSPNVPNSPPSWGRNWAAGAQPRSPTYTCCLAAPA